MDVYPPLTLAQYSFRELVELKQAGMNQIIQVSEGNYKIKLPRLRVQCPYTWTPKRNTSID